MGHMGPGSFTPTQGFLGAHGGMGVNSTGSAPGPLLSSALFSSTAAAGATGLGGVNTLDSVSSAPSSVMYSVGSPMAQGGAGGFTGGWPGSGGGMESGGGAPKSPLGGAAAAGGGFGPPGGGAAPIPGGAEEWRLLGDVQQWYNALLIKDKVGTKG